MLKLNLISPELKGEIKVRRYYQLIKPITVTIAVFACLASAYIWAGRMVLSSFREKTDREIFVSGGANLLENKYDLLDAQLSSIAKIQAEYVTPSADISAIAAQVGSDMHLDSIRFNYNDGSVTIRGWSKQRDELVKFKERLEKSDIFESVDLPINSMVSKENIDFELKAKITKKP